MYYPQYNVYKPGWYGPTNGYCTSNAVQHATAQGSTFSCMHEEQAAWAGQLLQTNATIPSHLHHHVNHNASGPPASLANPTANNPPVTELWEDQTVLTATSAVTSALSTSPSLQQGAQLHNTCSAQIVDHHIRAQPPRSPFEWMKKPSYQSQPNPGKTRTKDKYRVVYTDHQRLELEKEFHYSRYITIRRKAELATLLGLSERQVKIWFQNRRAKERKQMKKREELIHKEKMQQLAML
ncbi:uncharacterized protein [Rhodnius prolixus]|uniref:Homeobox domain-containing protein n=1 Tax=Rhodnius prolixus TaxID=13249 RepID=T1H8A0_RHOPR